MTLNREIKRLERAAIGFAKPSYVTYYISTQNFKELFNKFCMEYVKFDNLPIISIKDEPSINNKNEHILKLSIDNYEDLTDDDKYRCQALFYINTDTDHKENFAGVLSKLFSGSDIVAYTSFKSNSKETDEEIDLIEIVIEYSAFEKHGIPFYKELTDMG